MHPTLGRLSIDHEVLLVGDYFSQRLLTWLPADAATAAAFEQDAAGTPVSPAQLRVVGEA